MFFWLPKNVSGFAPFSLEGAVFGPFFSHLVTLVLGPFFDQDVSNYVKFPKFYYARLVSCRGRVPVPHFFEEPANRASGPLEFLAVRDWCLTGNDIGWERSSGCGMRFPNACHFGPVLLDLVRGIALLMLYVCNTYNILLRAPRKLLCAAKQCGTS